MANLINVTVTKVTEATTGNFIHTLKTEGKTIKVLGQDMPSNSLTYYAALKGPAELNSKGDIDLDAFDIVERPFNTTDKDTGEELTLKLKWLYPKK
jgi:hypothetical protein